MIRVRAPSRLHFGLLNCGTVDEGLNREGQSAVPTRRFGGAGLMVEQPGLSLTVQPAAEWSASGPLADRALAVAQRFAQTLAAGMLGPQQLVIEHSPPEHVGLGTGTQLAMAVGHALAETTGIQLSGVDLARRVGRGERSAIGVHGFLQGGFLVDGGRGSRDAAAPLLARMEFPEEWRIVLVLPAADRGRHGPSESEAFQQLGTLGLNLTATERLCRLLLLGMLPALIEHDLAAFGEALYEYNARSGELFAEVQGGTYVNARVTELVGFLRREGVRGVGQSSWGPTVFAVTSDADAASHLGGRLRMQYSLGPGEVLCVPAVNKTPLAVRCSV